MRDQQRTILQLELPERPVDPISECSIALTTWRRVPGRVGDPPFGQPRVGSRTLVVGQPIPLAEIEFTQPRIDGEGRSWEGEIGRASCRERVWVWAGGVTRQ